MSNDTKEQIIKVVLQIIGQHGVQQITVREIARQAKVNVAAINYHFGSKEQLIKQSMDFYTKTMSGVLSILDEEGDPKEKMLKFLNKFVENAIYYPGVTKSFISKMMSPEEIDPLLTLTQKQGIGKMVKILRELTTNVEEEQLKLLGLQIMSAILYPVLINKQLPELYEFDYINKENREMYVELLFKNFIG